MPGWSVINGQNTYLGKVENERSWFQADAKALEVNGKLLEIRSPSDNAVLDAIKGCEFFRQSHFGRVIKLQKLVDSWDYRCNQIPIKESTILVCLHYTSAKFFRLVNYLRLS